MPTAKLPKSQQERRLAMQGTHESTLIVTTLPLPYSVLLEQRPLKDYDDNTFDQNGISVTIRTYYIIVDALNRRLHPPSYFTAYSWTGIPTPVDKQAVCANPWKLHKHRTVFVDVDGEFMPKSFIVLCDDCINYNEKLKTWSKRLMIFYNPVTY